MQLSRKHTIFHEALSTSKHELVEYGSGTTFYVIETSVCAQIRSVLSLGVRALCESHHK